MKGNKTVRCAFYGSLRTGMYNNRMMPESVSLGEKEIDGFKMYSLGAYPYILRSDKGKIKVELFDVPMEEFSRIDRMEIGAGYNRETVEIDGKDTVIYIYKFVNHTPDIEEVESGDWAEVAEY